MSRRAAIVLSVLLAAAFLLAIFWRDLIAAGFVVFALTWLRKGAHDARA